MHGVKASMTWTPCRRARAKAKVMEHATTARAKDTLRVNALQLGEQEKKERDPSARYVMERDIQERIVPAKEEANTRRKAKVKIQDSGEEKVQEARREKAKGARRAKERGCMHLMMRGRGNGDRRQEEQTGAYHS